MRTLRVRRRGGTAITTFACTVAAVASLFGLRANAEGSANLVEIRGFRVDVSPASENQKRKLLPSLERQIAIVESVNLPEEVLGFFRTVPIVVNPALTKMNGEYAQVDGGWAVGVKPVSLPDDRAILLHELLHAYQHQILKPPVPEIGRAYREALLPKTYPKNYREAYFLTNPREYFAVAGEVYLFGKTKRPPFACSNIMSAQPQFVAYLGQLFGERPCK